MVVSGHAIARSSHEVERGRVRQAQPDRAQDGAVGGRAHVVFVDDRRDGIVPTDVRGLLV
jgi:hypothetical protein